MPISAERMKRYPGGSIYSKEWKAFRASLLERAVNCCEGTPRAVSNLRNSTSRITPSPAQEANTMQSEESNTLVKLAKAVIEHAPEGADAFWDIKFSDIEAALSAAGPVSSRNDEAGYVEFLNEDVPYIVRDIQGAVAILTDLETRNVIGYRVYDPDSAFAPQPVPSVAVKALEWNPYRAETPFGYYDINDQRDVPESELKGRDPFLLTGSRLDYSRHPTLDAARAAAQADYKARIRSTLSAQALSATSVAVKTLQWDDDGGNLKARMGDREWMLNITADGKTWAGSTRPFVFDRNLTWSAVPNCSGVSLEAAKAACQADCLSRYAALSAQVQDVAEDIYIAADDVSGTSGAWVQQGSYTGDVDVHRFGALQEGWQLVPEDATDEMVSAALKVDWGNEDEEGVAHDIWHAMVAAAPAKQEG
ncbi:hypothetical protein FY137_07135 [Agrobacterium tumefaciens]|nr:hypothetical protein FY137_07135 [Agrobacterium tumefaciens]